MAFVWETLVKLEGKRRITPNEEENVTEADAILFRNIFTLYYFFEKYMIYLKI